MGKPCSLLTELIVARSQFSACSTNADSDAHLLVHEDVDHRVNDRAGLGQDGRDDAGLGRYQVRRAEGGHQGHHAVRQPAQQVADDHDDDHEQHPLLALPAHGGVDAADLTVTGRRGAVRRKGKWPCDAFRDTGFC